MTCERYLGWGVKASFVTYVRATGGAIQVTAPAFETPDSFGFPLRSVETANDGVRLMMFGGSVCFRAHGGLLELHLHDPWLQVRAHAIQLTVQTAESAGFAGRRIVVADVEHPGGEVFESGTEQRTSLSGDGAALFDLHYPPGTELAPVRWGG